ncbi:MAG: extracellular solute-binding protein [Desulfobulbaceae bacterium]|nr:extracellular solute-binding protein [Desulfobulbaceae bacterium]
MVYTSLDQLFSEPVLEDFQDKTGIKVKTVYDVEASKTMGLFNRLLAEKANPQCDVFWNSEVGRTIILKNEGVLTPYVSPSAEDIPAQFKDVDGFWTGFAARARVLVYNTDLLEESELPESILELAEPGWKGRVALAYPLFGTTATHVAALWTHLGPYKTKKYLKSLKANDIIIVDGNAVARNMVVRGRVPLAFTDTDDVNVAVQSGKPVKMVYPDSQGMGALFIPNTVAMIKDCPHQEEAKHLIDYLLSREVESRLAFSESAQVPVRDGVATPAHVPSYSSVKAMVMNYEEIAKNMKEATRFCQELFVR